jgi:hypothetical protein
MTVQSLEMDIMLTCRSTAPKKVTKGSTDSASAPDNVNSFLTVKALSGAQRVSPSAGGLAMKRAATAPQNATPSTPGSRAARRVVPHAKTAALPSLSARRPIAHADTQPGLIVSSNVGASMSARGTPKSAK